MPSNHFLSSLQLQSWFFGRSRWSTAPSVALARPPLRPHHQIRPWRLIWHQEITTFSRFWIANIYSFYWISDFPFPGLHCASPAADSSGGGGGGGRRQNYIIFLYKAGKDWKLQIQSIKAGLGYETPYAGKTFKSWTPRTAIQSLHSPVPVDTLHSLYDASVRQIKQILE